MEGVTIIETTTLQALITEVQHTRQVVIETVAELKEQRKPYLNVNEVMALTGFGKTWIMANKQHIGYSSVAGQLRFKRKDVEEFMEQNYFKTKQPRRRAS